MSTLTPLDNMGVMTMKMISSTSITSTIGVTLMSDTTSGAFLFHRIPPLPRRTRRAAPMRLAAADPA